MTTAFQVKNQNQSHERVRVAAYNTDNTGKPVGEPMTFTSPVAA